ncbi:MAG: DUF2490 domain-containing protein [Prolixibacteraceae bacterium]|nr:DUF2490 domain-containing protein [Prolixibacteraceae bacterium]MBN2775521.1 DUF2490 domain-containing protein [Prolixibacteraceae bacterium]
MKRLLIISVLIFSSSCLLEAQQTWIETEISKEIINNLELSVSPQLRFRKSFDLKEYFFDTSIEYKFSRYFQLGAGYRLGNSITKKNNTKSFGRFNVDFKTSVKWHNFQPKFRLRYSNAGDFGDEENEPVNYLRYKPELEFSIKKLKAQPYVTCEWYHNLDTNKIAKFRFETGAMFKISKKHWIGGYYRLNKYLHDDKNSVGIFGISYKLKL